MNRRLPLTLALLALASPAAAQDLHWGDFKDNGCINPVTRPGLRAYSSVLWGIPFGASWEDACASAPAPFSGVTLAHPTVCVNTSLADPVFIATGSLTGAALCAAGVAGVDVLTKGAASGLYELCIEIAKAGIEYSVEEGEDYYHGPPRAIESASSVSWPVSSLHGFVPSSQSSSWKGTLAGTITQKPATQLRQSDGGLNIWGVFAVPDESCLPPDYTTVENINWQQASDVCSSQGMKLCSQEQLCDGGAPVAGAPSGDYWAATSDGDNSWISVGTSYPERQCRTHQDVTGSKPSWGADRGPQPVTGNPTLFRCCP